MIPVLGPGLGLGLGGIMDSFREGDRRHRLGRGRGRRVAVNVTVARSLARSESNL